MKILLLSVGDNGGGCYWLSDAINKYTEHVARSVRFVQSWINYPYDIFAPSNGQLQSLIDWADILHIRDNVSDKWPVIPKGKSVVVTWTGMSYRKAAGAKLQKCKNNGWATTVSTPDLISYAPDNLKPTWLPNPREEMKRTEQNGQFTVCHAPTFRDRKGTQLVIEACSRLGVMLSLVEDMKYFDALKEKSKCDVVVDQVGPYSFGYGNNAIEAWAMGIPVISGASQPKYTQYTRGIYGKLPYIECSTVDDIYKAADLLKNPIEYAKWRDIGLDYFYKFHHAPIVAASAIKIYKTIL